MDESYLGQVVLWAPGFIPQNWMSCEGQSLEIAQYQALFSLLGTNYGGDGRSTFNLPDLREKDENGQPIPMIELLRRGKLAHIICVSGLYPRRP